MSKVKVENVENLIVGNNLKSLREIMGFNQEKVAEYLGIDRANISLFENGERLPSMVHLQKLSNLFDVSVHELFEKHVSITKNAFAFKKTSEVTALDMEKIARFRRIVSNFLKFSER